MMYTKSNLTFSPSTRTEKSILSTWGWAPSGNGTRIELAVRIATSFQSPKRAKIS